MMPIQKKYQSYGDGRVERQNMLHCGKGVIIEDGVRIFNPERVEICDGVYIGHDTIINGYLDGNIKVGSGTWIGAQCFLHGAGGITIGNNVGIGPGVRMVTSYHLLDDQPVILHSKIEMQPVIIGDNSDIGVAAILMPGVTIGEGAQVGAGAVVTSDVPPYCVVAGNPARRIRDRKTHPGDL